MADSLCLRAETYQNEWSTPLNSGGNVFSCCVAVILLVYVVITRKKKVSAMHFNFKIIVYNIWWIVFFYLTSTIIAYCYDLYLQHTSSPCQNTYIVWQCLAFRWPIALGSCSMNFFHFAVFFERTAATRLFRQYEMGCKLLGVIVLIVTWLTVLTIFFYVYRQDDYSAVLPVCSVTQAVNERRIQNMAYFMLTVNLLVAAGEIYLWKVNRCKVKTRINNHYSLAISYQKTENYLTSVLVLPISITHSILYMSYLTTAQVIRYFVSAEETPVLHVTLLTLAHQIIYIDIVVCLLLYIYISRRVEEERKVREIRMKHGFRTEMYFDMLRRQLQ
ncbi:unnamed protein product [Bursaphelenchus xylophilus]|uniref:(pine wood nematode) hypothetical protein n=1 Tax=Bursaphelenchus xylophilus TaxID=6326 RepID=A0A7I8X8B0_BURXY|nr:unnamed protein product [Bursaphelenchus xylophilus]CAG9126586.1 unnamed protein product [Bursaphelenchus xylophilus]